MAEISYEDMMSGRTSPPPVAPPPGAPPQQGELSYEEMMGMPRPTPSPSSTPTATPSLTPFTDVALKESSTAIDQAVGQGRSTINRLLFDPQVAQNLRQSIQNTVYGIPQMALDFAKGAYQTQRLQYGPPQEQARALANLTAQSMGMGRAISQGLQSPPGSVAWWDAMQQVAMMAAPSVELFRGVHAPIPTPTTARPIPPPPVPRPGTEFVQPGARGFVGVPGATAPTDFAGQPVEQPPIGEPYAVKPSYAQVEAGPAALGVEAGAGRPVTEAGRGDYAVGEAQGAEAGRPVPQPVPTAEAVAPPAPEANAPGQLATPYFVEKHGSVYAVVDRRRPNDIVGIPSRTVEEAQARKDQLDRAFIAKQAAEQLPGTPGAAPEVAVAQPVEVTPAERRAAIPADAEPWEVRLQELFHDEEQRDLTPVEASEMDQLSRIAAEKYGNFQEWYDQRIRGIQKTPITEEPAPAGAPSEIGPTDRIQALTDEIQGYRDRKEPIPLALTQELREVRDSLPTPKAIPVPEQLTPADRARFEALQDQAVNLKNDVGSYLGRRPQSAAELSAQDKLWQTYSELHQLLNKAGEPRDFAIIGGGAGGLKAAGHAAYEGVDTTVFEKEPSTGGQAKRSMELVNVGESETGATGRSYFRPRYLTAKNRGAEIRTGVTVQDLIQRPDGGVDVVTNKGTFPYRRVAILTGAKVVPHPELGADVHWGNAERLARAAKGRVAMTYGSGNSATQAVFGAIREGAQKIIMLSRSSVWKEASADQAERLEALAKQGKIQFVRGTLDHAEPSPTGGVIAVLKDGKRIPVSHVEAFLDTDLNTGWIPPGIEKVQMPPPRPGRTAKNAPVKVINASLKSTMPGVYVGGDIRQSLPFEERPRRIDAAEGDAAGIAARVTSDIYNYRKTGTFEPWNKPETPESIDEHLKILKDIEGPTSRRTAAVQTPSRTPIGGQPTISPPTRSPISTPTLPERATELRPGLPTTEPVRPSAPPVQVRPEAPPVQTPPVQRAARGWDEAITAGHDWLNTGGNVDNIIRNFRSTGQADTWDVGRLQAYSERLQSQTNAAGDLLRKRPNDPELQRNFQAAVDRENAFSKDAAPIRAVAKTQNPQLQGHVPLDPEAAGSYTGLSRRFHEIQDRAMTGRESTHAGTIADHAQRANGEYSRANSDLYTKMDKEFERIRTDREGPATDQTLADVFNQRKEVCG